MKRVAVLMWALLVLPAGAPGDEKAPDEKSAGVANEALEILKKTDSAAKGVQLVRYKVEATASGDLREPAPEITGTYVLSGITGMRPEKFLIDIKVRQPNSEEVKHYTSGGDGENFFLIDHHSKKAYQDIDPNVMGSANRYLWPGLMMEFVVDTPFKDEIDAKSHSLGEGRTIGGVECHEVHVVYSETQKATWYFSKEDFLPRGRIDEGKRRDGSSVTRSKFLSAVETDAAVKDVKFTLELPEGYEEIDDFAP